MYYGNLNLVRSIAGARLRSLPVMFSFPKWVTAINNSAIPINYSMMMSHVVLAVPSTRTATDKEHRGRNRCSVLLLLLL